jgi:uncharacterized integral membrane protein
MNLTLLIKTIFIIALLALLVIMGMNNQASVTLSMPRILPKDLKQPAALMYFGFFAVGFLAGTIMMAGGKKGGTNKVKTEK